MLKISRIRPSEYNKSCSILHNESNKIGFAIYLIFYDFPHILQVSAKWFHYWRYRFARQPPEVLRSYDYALGLHQAPWKDQGTRNWVPGAAGGGRRRNPVEGELQTPMALFRGLLGAEAPPACPGAAAARAGWLLRGIEWVWGGDSVGASGRRRERARGSSPWGANGGRRRRTQPRWEGRLLK
jgi:hypothetical protein